MPGLVVQPLSHAKCTIEREADRYLYIVGASDFKGRLMYYS